MSKQRRTNKSLSAADLLRPLLKKSQRKRGFGDDVILRHWPEIVGKEIAHYCVPQKLGGGEHRALTIWCDPAFATQVHYQTDLILEKIAAFCGHRAVEKLIIRQHPVHAQVEEKKSLRPLTEAEKERIDSLTADTEDDALRERLQSIASLRCRLLSE